MDNDLLLIFSFITVALVITGLTVNGVVAKVLNHKKEMREFERLAAPRAAPQADDRTDLIEARLQVLERIATDPTQNLADEIESLRLSSSEHLREQQNNTSPETARDKELG